MTDGCCTKLFPKEHRNQNGTDNDVVAQCYVTLKRRWPVHGGEHDLRGALISEASTSFQKNVPVDNVWVVSYNLHLFRMITCNINMEICISREPSIKYLFKFVCKGHYCLTIHLIKNNGHVYDGVQNCQEFSYITAPGAVGKIWGYDIMEARPNVEL